MDIVSFMLQVLVAFIASEMLPVASATYYMDDKDPLIRYSPPGAWVPGTNVGDYNGTTTNGLCYTTDHCYMVIPFTGTGITLYATLVPAINFAVSIDGDGQVYFQHDSAPVCDTCRGIYNFTLYNIQLLDFGLHSLNLTLLDATGSNPGDSGGRNRSLLYFDYAVVNGSQISPTSLTTAPTQIHGLPTSSIIAIALGGSLGVMVIATAAYLTGRSRINSNATTA